MKYLIDLFTFKRYRELSEDLNSGCYKAGSLEKLFITRLADDASAKSFYAWFWFLGLSALVVEFVWLFNLV